MYCSISFIGTLTTQGCNPKPMAKEMAALRLDAQHFLWLTI